MRARSASPSWRWAAAARHADDAIDPSVGLTEFVDVGQRDPQRQPLCLVHAASEADADEAIALVRQAVRIDEPRRRPTGRSIMERIVAVMRPRTPMRATASGPAGLPAGGRLRRPAGARGRAGGGLRSRPGAHGLLDPRPGAMRATATSGSSGGDIRFFVEEEAPDQLNKIGHALHDLDPVFDRFSRQPRLAALARELGLEPPLLLQSMYLFKQPHVGGEVGWHQDATYLHTDPLSVTGFWIALDDADRDNGCLMALPGAHRGPLRQWFRREGERAGHPRRSMPRRGRPSSRWRWRSGAARWSCCTACCRMPARPTARRGRAMPIALHLIDGRGRLSEPTTGCNGPTCRCEGFA